MKMLKTVLSLSFALLVMSSCSNKPGSSGDSGVISSSSSPSSAGYGSITLRIGVPGNLGAVNASIKRTVVADFSNNVDTYSVTLTPVNGYNSAVEEGGATLSVGQRQLISFARALLANPRILILDEATSSVDTQTEQIIQKALGILLKGRTSFVIAHRLSTVLHADRIVVLNDKRIEAVGRHAELLERSETYARLYRLQFTERCCFLVRTWWRCRLQAHHQAQSHSAKSGPSQGCPR